MFQEMLRLPIMDKYEFADMMGFMQTLLGAGVRVYPNASDLIESNFPIRQTLPEPSLCALLQLTDQSSLACPTDYVGLVSALRQQGYQPCHMFDLLNFKQFTLMPADVLIISDPLKLYMEGSKLLRFDMCDCHSASLHVLPLGLIAQALQECSHILSGALFQLKFRRGSLPRLFYLPNLRPRL